MLEKFKYINHKNEVLEFGSGSLFANENDLRDFEWNVSSKNDKISGFKKGIVKKTIPIIIKCDTKEQGIEMRNKIFEITEKDILANQYGRIVVGDYYLKCYVIGNTKSDYLVNKQYMLIDLDIQTDCPGWIRETTTLFKPIEEVRGGEYLDYEHDMPFDYKRGASARTLTNENFVPSDFKMIIFGAVLSPAIYIGDYKYAVNTEIGLNEYLTIDSVNKTIYLTKINGEKVNCFNDRDREYRIFEKIPPGMSFVSSSTEGMTFEITLYEERSEPKWT